jgi:two-component system sensor histidine kinase VicK
MSSTVISRNHDLPFLEGGGEMGELTRSYHWTDHPLGEPLNWPQSLKTTLSIILNSKFPMFLWWGAELYCFYNNAYRPSLGNIVQLPEMKCMLL